MRSTDEQLNEVVARSVRLQARSRSKRAVLIESLASAACLVLIAIVWHTLPSLRGTSDALVDAGLGSFVITGPDTGYVAICLLSFLLGICVALLCVHVREWRKK